MGSSNTEVVSRTTSQLAGKRLVIIEDEPVVKLGLEVILQSAGAVVARSFDQKLDGAILDVNLGNGVNVMPIAGRLRQRNVPFIFYSALPEANLAPVRKAFPTAIFISKPAEARRLVSAVADLWRTK